MEINKSETLSPRHIDKLIKQHVSAHTKKMKRLSRALEKRLIRKIDRHIEKELTLRIKDIKKESEKVGINAADNMLSIIKERVERHVIHQVKRQVYKEIDHFEDHLSTLRSDKEAVEHQCIIDPLTQTHNRRYFECKSIEECQIAKKYQTFLSFLMLDIDHFKQFNDNYGHQSGDAILKQLVSCINEILRQNATLFRYGGEEFMIMLPQTNHNHAFNIAQRIRSMIEEYPFVLEEQVVHVTVSIGLSTYPQHATTCEELVSQADHALYRAKQAGRNNVCIAHIMEEELQ